MTATHAGPAAGDRAAAERARALGAARHAARGRGRGPAPPGSRARPPRPPGAPRSPLTAGPPATAGRVMVARRVVTTTAPASTSERRPERAPITRDIMAVGIAAMMTTVLKTSPEKRNRLATATPSSGRQPEAHHDRRSSPRPTARLRPRTSIMTPGVEHGQRQGGRAEDLEGALDEVGQVASAEQVDGQPAASARWARSQAARPPRAPAARGCPSGRP